MNNFDDIFESAAASGQPDTRPQWQVRQQRNLENAYAMIDTALDEISQGQGDVPGYLDIQARFDRYSARNVLLVQKQRPTATRLGDKKYWREQGVAVLRAELRKPVIILEAGREYTRDDGSVGQYYNAKEVYDISQTTGRDQVQPQVSVDGRLLLKALISRSPAPIQVVDTLPDGRGAVFNQEQGAIQVRRGMDAANIFRSVSLELCHVDLKLQTVGYSRSEDGYKAYCASYLLCKKYGIDVRSYDLSGIQGVLAGKELREIAGELSDIKETASAISARMSRALEQNRQSKSKEQGR